MKKLVDKTIDLQLVGLNGNAYALMGAFQKKARQEGWSKEEIDTVLEQAKLGDYDQLVATLMIYCEPNDENYDEE